MHEQILPNSSLTHHPDTTKLILLTMSPFECNTEPGLCEVCTRCGIRTCRERRDERVRVKGERERERERERESWTGQSGERVQEEDLERGTSEFKKHARNLQQRSSDISLQDFLCLSICPCVSISQSAPPRPAPPSPAPVYPPHSTSSDCGSLC